MNVDALSCREDDCMPLPTPVKEKEQAEYVNFIQALVGQEEEEMEPPYLESLAAQPLPDVRSE